MHQIVVAVGFPVANMYLYLANKMIGWASELIQTAATIRRHCEATST